jgi:hypothetical protein
MHNGIVSAGIKEVRDIRGVQRRHGKVVCAQERPLIYRKMKCRRTARDHRVLQGCPYAGTDEDHYRLQGKGDYCCCQRPVDQRNYLVSHRMLLELKRDNHEYGGRS